MNKVWEIFKDDNSWNEKTIIGFLSFAVMVLAAIVDIGTGIFGINLEIKEFIYNSFTVLTLGSFGIAGLEKFSPTAKVKAENEGS
jgi:hypothetical protein